MAVIKASKWSKRVLAGAGAYLFAALFKDFTDDASRPVWTFLRNGLLDAITYGVTSFKDAIYTSIARGYHEEPGWRLLHWALGTLLAFITLAVATLVQVDAPGRRRRLLGGRLMHSRPFRQAAVLYFVVAAAFITSDCIVGSYESNAVSHFEQALKIDAPVLSPAAVVKYRSRFAQISQSADYWRIDEELDSIAKSNALRMPEFRVW